MTEKNVLGTVAVVLSAIAAINLGLTGLGYNVLKMIFGSIPVLEMIIYVILGIAGLVLLYTYFTMD